MRAWLSLMLAPPASSMKHGAVNPALAIGEGELEIGS